MTQSYDISGDHPHRGIKRSDSSSPDEFVFVVGQDGLPVSVKQEAPPEYPLSLELHPIPKHETGIDNSVLVSIHPPRQPEQPINHVSCDIVLVIDVSGSMAAAAPLPDVKDGAEQEVSGLSILDLTKHAAKTIIETLNDGDRLAIVTFSKDARIIQSLTRMTKAAKKKTVQQIEKLEEESNTNLWSGIRTGLQIIEQSKYIGNVQGIYVLTDGQPNHMCPNQGYVRKLEPMLEEMATSRPCVPTIHTFGFGYDILSNLLQSIAEVGNGNYSFIPDAGMIGTVFVHAVANLYSTYATSARLKVVTAGQGGVKSMLPGINSSEDDNEVIIELGNLQYGHSRDNIVQLELPKSGVPVVATLTYTLPSGISYTITSSIDPFESTGLPQPVVDFHIHRHRFLQYLGGYFVRGRTGEYLKHPRAPTTGLSDIDQMVSEIHSTSVQPFDASLAALLQDLKQSSPEEQDGQVSHALTQTTKKPYWNKWGRHYLPSLWHAHLRQQCNSFKDPGPSCYGKDSPLFIKCRDQLDKAFDDLPAPKPSLTGSYLQRIQHSAAAGGGGARNAPRLNQNVSMSRYNFAGNPCFLGSCMVKMVDDGASVNGMRDRELRVQDLRSGMHVLNLLTGEARKIVAIVKTPTQDRTQQQICRIGDGLWITPYHPIFHRVSRKWVFPIDVADEVRDLEAGEAVYSILLSPSNSASSHAAEIGGVSCVTLGHGLTSTESGSAAPSTEDVRAHSFFGDYDAVLRSITALPQNSEDMYICAGITRDEKTGLADGFVPDLSYSLSSSTIVADEDEDEETSTPASKQVFDFTSEGICVVGHCSPVTMSFSSPLLMSGRCDEPVWWHATPQPVGVAA